MQIARSELMMSYIASPADVEAMFPEVNLIRDSQLQTGVMEIWIDIMREMAWEDLHHVPKDTGAEMYRPLIEHIRGVTQMAIGLAGTAAKIQHKEIDLNLLISACLLHDASKPLETEPDADGTIDPISPKSTAKPGKISKIGYNIQHGVLAAHKALDKGLPLELINLIISHTHKSNVRSRTLEGSLLFYADYADSDTGLARAGRALFSERWRI